MNTITLSAPAKINLALDILAKDPSGYHEIETIFFAVPSLSDGITLEKKRDGIDVLWSGKIPAPNPAENLVFKAAQLFFKQTGIRGGVTIHIEKYIPVGAGFGGGSSDAAATLKGLNTLYNTHVSEDDLRFLAAQIGMDVPFFISGGTAHGTHFGEKVTQLPDAKMPVLDFVFSNIVVHTKDAYAAVDLALCGKRTHDTHLLLDLIRNGKPIPPALCHNDFVFAIQKLYPHAFIQRTSTFWLTGASTTFVYQKIF